MDRPTEIPADRKVRIALSVLAGEVSIAQAARREQVSQQSISRWVAEFLEAGKAGLAASSPGEATREERLEAQVSELTQALDEANLQARVWKKSAERRSGFSSSFK